MSSPLAAPAGYEHDVFRALRIMFGTAVRPGFDDNGLLVSPTAKQALYTSLSAATSVLMDGSEAFARACVASTTAAEMHAAFVRATVQEALMGAAVQTVVLAFSRETRPFAVGELMHLQALRNRPVQPPPAMQWLRTDGRGDELLRGLLEHLVGACPLRAGMVLVVSGLTHLWWPDAGVHMPLCVRLAGNGAEREVVPPWVAFPEDVLDPRRVPMPRAPEEWFRSAESAVDHLKFWAMAMRYRRAGKMCVVCCEEPRLLVELLALIETHAARLPAEAQPDAADVSRIMLVHTIVAGYTAKLGSTATPPELDRHAPVRVLEQIDVGSVATLMGIAHAEHAARSGLGAGPAVALLFALWLRPHHGNAQPFVRHLGRANPCSAYQLWVDLLAHKPQHVRAPVLELDAVCIEQTLHDERPEHPTACDAIVPSVDYEAMAALLLALGRAPAPAAASAAQSSAPGSPLPADGWAGEQQLRAHAARLALWLASALNCAPAYRLPNADAHSPPSGAAPMPLYGYARPAGAADERLAVVDKMPQADRRRRYTVY
jgi:hypothetical protein